MNRAITRALVGAALAAGTAIGSAGLAHADLSGKYSVSRRFGQFYVTATANCATEGCTASLVSNRGWTAVATLHNNIWTYSMVKPQGAICADGSFADIVMGQPDGSIAVPAARRRPPVRRDSSVRCLL